MASSVVLPAAGDNSLDGENMMSELATAVLGTIIGVMVVLEIALNAITR